MKLNLSKLILIPLCLALNSCGSSSLSNAPDGTNSSNGVISAPASEDFNALAREPNFLTFFSNTYDGNQKIAQGFEDNPDKRFIRFVDEAKKTLDICVFEIDSVDMTDAIIAAHERGIRVRLVVDSQTNDKGNSIKRLKKAGIPIVDDGGRSAYMHNKFAIVDSAWVWTGSYNLTNNSSWKHNDNVIKINSRYMAANYIAEFEEMFIHKKFGRTSPNNIKHRTVRVNQDKTVTTLFAPEDDVIGAIIKEISKAKSSIKFMGFSFTHEDVANALIKKARNGVKIEGIFEQLGSNTNWSAFGRLSNGDENIKLSIKKPAQAQALMHHKVFIIDGKITITGSFNFSKNASLDNDENVLIINSVSVANAYTQEFFRVNAKSDSSQ